MIYQASLKVCRFYFLLLLLAATRVIEFTLLAPCMFLPTLLRTNSFSVVLTRRAFYEIESFTDPTNFLIHSSIYLHFVPLIRQHHLNHFGKTLPLPSVLRSLNVKCPQHVSLQACNGDGTHLAGPLQFFSRLDVYCTAFCNHKFQVQITRTEADIQYFLSQRLRLPRLCLR